MRFALPFLLLAPVAEAGEFTPPEGCTAFLSVQSRSCSVTHYWTCEGNAAGEQWSGELDATGLVYVGQIDHEAQWLVSYYSGAAEEETLMLPARDPANLTALLATGSDTYDFMLNTTNGVQQVIGIDRIVERGVMIDGEPLHRTEIEMRILDAEGTVIYTDTGNEYVSEKHRRFFGGVGRYADPETPIEYNQTPVEFIYPGEAGFLSDTPKYDCAVVTARHETQEKDTQP